MQVLRVPLGHLVLLHLVAAEYDESSRWIMPQNMLYQMLPKRSRGTSDKNGLVLKRHTFALVVHGQVLGNGLYGSLQPQ